MYTCLAFRAPRPHAKSDPMGVLHGYHATAYLILRETGHMGDALSPLCVVAASEYRAARELAERSWMATMLSNIAVFALLVQWEDTRPTLLGGD